MISTTLKTKNQVQLLETAISSPILKIVNLEKVIPLNFKSICRITTNNKIKFCNADFITSSGYSEKELLKNDYTLISHPEMPKLIQMVIQNHLSKNKSITSIVKNRAKDGSYYWTKSTFIPNRSNNDLTIAYAVKSEAISRNAKQKIDKLYQTIYKIERHHDFFAASKYLIGFLEEEKLNYENYILKITKDC